MPTKWTVEAVENLIKEMIAWLSEPEGDNIFPGEFMVKKGYYPNLISGKIKAFQNENPAPDLTEIYRLYSIAQKISEMKLVKKGLTKKYDPTITKLVLSNKYGYREGIEQAARGGLFFQQNILNPAIQDKSAAELARNYQQIVRSLPGSQSIPLPGTEEISADIE